MRKVEGRDTPGTVLVVEDEAAVLRFTAGMLAQLGFAVICAVDGVQALAVFHEHRQEIGVVLLDLTLPGMDGEAVLSQLQREERAVPVVVVSGLDADDLRERFVGRRVAGFLQKPYRREQLRAVLNDALSSR